MEWRRIKNSLILRIQALLGKGFHRSWFEEFYRLHGPDAWSYARNTYNEERFEFIVESIPHQAVDRVLEIGCAEGQMTRLLARRAGSVVAVDFVEEALDRARENCSGLSNVGFVAGDVRNGLPPGSFDAAVASDVFYYLSVSELLDVLRLLGGSLRPGGSLVVAEFSPGSAKLPSRLEDVLRLCGSSTAWELVTDRSLVLRENGDGVRVALFRCGSGGLPTAARFSIRTRSRLPNYS